MLSAQLKEHTKTNHQLLEKKLVAQMKNISTKQDYAALLVLFYSFFGGLEVAMGKHPDLSFLPDYAQRRKSVALANDLGELGAMLPAFATNQEMPQIKNNLQTIGALYVMEGSTLGGQYIVKMIEKQLGTNSSLGYSFFNGYGENTEAMWQGFKNAIDGLALPFDEEAIVVEAANDTFLHFSKWFDVHQ